MLELQCDEKELHEQLLKVKKRLLVLDIIEEKLFLMRELAQKVIEEDLSCVEKEKSITGAKIRRTD